MKIGHWTMWNKSGMNRVAESIVEAEKRLGIDSVLCNVQDDTNWDFMLDADIHVTHTHFPDSMRKKITKPLKLIYVAHGTPEHIFHSSVETGTNSGYGHGDGWMLYQYWMQNADAIVTFWDRHKAIMQTLCDKRTIIDCLPLGVDKEFWSAGTTKGKYAGNPSVWTGENQHYIKWSMDLMMMWKWVYQELDGACLHQWYMPTNLHRWFFPLVNRSGASYGAHITGTILTHEELRNVFKSIDFFLGLVRYGDHNRICLEANAAGAKTISYAGNVYSDYWIQEGDQREQAKQLVEILKGHVEPRKKEEVPDFLDTARGMIKIYERIA